MSPAGRRELGLFGDHARRHTADIGNCCAAEAERVAAAGLLLFGRVGLAAAAHIATVSAAASNNPNWKFPVRKSIINPPPR